jgi:hypothetical protein
MALGLDSAPLKAPTSTIRYPYLVLQCQNVGRTSLQIRGQNICDKHKRLQGVEREIQVHFQDFKEFY